MVLKRQIALESKAPRGLKTESATHSGGCVFQSAGQHSYSSGGGRDGVLKPLLGGFRKILRIELYIRQQRLDSPGQAGFIATGIGGVVLPGRLELSTGRWTAVIDTAPNAAADIAQQCDTTGSSAFGPNHNQSKIIQLFGHLQRDPTNSVVFGFAPVKGCPVKSAACTTTQTRIDAHWLHICRFQSA